MGISAVGVDGGDRRARRDHPGITYTSQDKLLHSIFRETSPLRDRLMHMTKCLINDAPKRRRSKLMRFELTVRPSRFKRLNQIRRTHHLDVVTSDQLDRTGIHARHIGNRIQRGILHGDTEATGEQARKDLPLLLPRHIAVGLSWQCIQYVRLDAMQQLDRSPLRRDPVVPSPGHMDGRIELEYTIGEGVAPAEIIEEPAVDLGITQCLLNFANTLIIWP